MAATIMAAVTASSGSPRPSLSSRRPVHQPSVNLLLSDFPSPPSFIPPSPSGFNPPPSLPPSGPLPPVPGPSPISSQDLSMISSVPARSRRASKISLNSSASWRDSQTSTSSGSNHPSPSTSIHTFGTPFRTRPESVTSVSQTSIRSAPSSSSLCPPRHTRHPSDYRPTAIFESDELDAPPLTRTSLADIPRATPSPQPPPVRDGNDDDLASVDMRDLPADDGDEEQDLYAQAKALHVQMRRTRSKTALHRAAQREPSPEPLLEPALRRRETSGSALSAAESAVSHPELNSSRTEPSASTVAPTRSRAESTRSRTDSVYSRVSSAQSHAMPPRPFPTRSAPPSSFRAPSPDIESIMAVTPRPRRRSETSSRASSRTRSRVASLPGSRRVSDALSHSSLPYADDWNEASFVDDYGEAPSSDEGEAKSGDSDLDLHTPLPNLMLKHGMLSPSSKLLGQSRATTPLDGRPGSTLSVGSVMTKSGVYKDDRDTVQRRIRHRDGKLLRGGLGLTTGLGWSDSEDEGAPSPLTRRVSSLTLSRSQSSQSLGSSARRNRSSTNPLARSQSNGAQITRSRGPPSAWSKSHTPRSASERHPPNLEEQPTHWRNSEPVPTTPRARTDSQATEPSTPSTASLRTPELELVAPPLGPRRRNGDREKSLPPLPRVSRGPSLKRETSGAALRREPSMASMNSAASLSMPSLRREPSTSALRPPTKYSSAVSPSPLPTSRSAASLSTTSLTPSTSTSDAEMSPLPSSASMPQTPLSPSGPRPLLTAAVGLQGLQPGEPVRKSLLGYNRNLHDAQRARYAAGTGLARAPSLGRSGAPRPGLPRVASQPALVGGLDEKPKPRTGTGMVYRKSGGNTLSASAPTAGGLSRRPSGIGTPNSLSVNTAASGRRVPSPLPSPTPSYTGAVAI
ncbi:hypothetical protein K488DRAFT_67168 [Vararia minispora EC-137]|uniref:Uncharacterized protein n=1 Tax=Vararia minispora EC-137 TaxID=1314806 RepID=A0ACB8QZB4_9AGAM|nr:hypothetical protein K488DRAFT_67168 [Vararia minispora EC-137]